MTNLEQIVTSLELSKLQKYVEKPCRVCKEVYFGNKRSFYCGECKVKKGRECGNRYANKGKSCPLVHSLPGERWKDIKGFEGLYQVSDKVRIKSLPRNTTKGGLLKQVTANGWYPCVSLCKDGVWKNYFVHRLIAEAFIDNPHNKPQVNHIDGNPLNNAIENLEWCTAKENTQHAHRTGLAKGRPGEQNPLAKLTREQVLKIRKTFESMQITYAELARQYSVDGQTISDIINRRRWKHI